MPVLELHKYSGICTQKCAKRLKVFTESSCRLVRAKVIPIDKVDPALLEKVRYYKSQHLSFSSYLENMFLEKVSGLNLELQREVYFNISNVSFYLDFLQEQDRVAIEIDGSQHELKDNKIYDINRDRAFAFIGIATLRLKKRDLLRDDFVSYFKERYRKAKEDAALLEDRKYLLKYIQASNGKRAAIRKKE